MKIYFLLFSHSLVKLKGIWVVGQFAPVLYHIFNVKGQNTRCHTYFFLGQNQAQGFFRGWLWQINVSIRESRCSQEPTKHSLLPLCFLGRPQRHRRINSVAHNSQVYFLHWKWILWRSYFWLLLFALLPAWNEAIPQGAWVHCVLGAYKIHGDSHIPTDTETQLALGLQWFEAAGEGAGIEDVCHSVAAYSVTGFSLRWWEGSASPEAEQNVALSALTERFLTGVLKGSNRDKLSFTEEHYGPRVEQGARFFLSNYLKFIKLFRGHFLGFSF